MVKVLDCTLRDGGYINEFAFGRKVMTDIVEKLSRASVDIIECGFLQAGADDPDKSLFGSVGAVRNVIGKKNPNTMYVAMIQYGKIGIEDIEPCAGDSVDGIRLTFHEHEIEEAFVLGRQLKEKKYKVFMQPVGTMSYTRSALLALIQRVNALQPYAFYMVDTLGVMYKKDILQMYALVDDNLNKDILVGYHSHNNLQLSFANAQVLLEHETDRDLIVDASVFGMGRGAGNLNTELITQYINDNICPRYNNTEILEILDLYIKPLSMQYQWGYDAPYYVSAVAGCHPNYAAFLMQKQTLRVQDIHHILHGLDVDKRTLYNKEYIHQQYRSFMDHHVEDTAVLSQLRTRLSRKAVILVAPGKSITQKATVEKIKTLAATGNYAVISVNFVPADLVVDMVFVSNKKRFDMLAVKDHFLIMTSNVKVQGNDSQLVLDYLSYTNEEPVVMDNAGLMCMNLLLKLDVHRVMLAGFDGFKTTSGETFADHSMYVDLEEEHRCNINRAMTRKLIQLRSQMDITFLTDSVYERWIEKIMN